MLKRLAMPLIGFFDVEGVRPLFVDHGESSTYPSGADVPSSRHRPGEGLANLASWLLVIAFVAFVLSVVAPAMSNGSGGDVAAALSFMVGFAASLAGTGMSFLSAQRRSLAVLGGAVLLAGLVGLYGLVPSIVALGVVLLGVAIQISSLPSD
ncbi:MAG: hypothetical protein QOJ32_945 [Frankiaceae bacterium]|nr:hypothetical protein [Frankiaceae bacterium]MDQ1649917.1 hypothetical protein [Frankiaceae bacterium]